MEFILNTDLAQLAPQVIDFNFEQLKAELSERVQHYTELVVTEDGVKDAKEDRAHLRKLKDAIDAQRKEVKSACLRPYESFERRCKELTALIDAPVNAIDAQIKSFEEAKRAEKKQSLEASFCAQVGDMASYITFSQVFNARWLNATYKEVDAACEMEIALDNCRRGVAAIRALNSDFETELLGYYAKSHDLSSVLSHAADLAARKVEESRRKQIPAPATPPAPAVLPKQEVQERALERTTAELISIAFRVWATAEQLAALKAFLLQNNIRFGKAV